MPQIAVLGLARRLLAALDVIEIAKAMSAMEKRCWQAAGGGPLADGLYHAAHWQSFPWGLRHASDWAAPGFGSS